MSIEENKALVRRLIEELFGRGDLAVADELLGPEEAAAHRAWVARLRGALPDMVATVDYLVAEGDLVAVFLTRRGTHTGVATGPFVDLLTPTGRIEPTGKVISTTDCFLYRVIGGKLPRLRRSSDNFGLFQQLGVLPTAAATNR